MEIYLKNHKYKYEVQSTLQIFYPNVKFQYIEQYDVNETYEFLVMSKYDNIQNTFETIIIVNGKEESSIIQEVLDDKVKRWLKISIFKALVSYTKYKPKWGILSGIKPTKIVYDLINKNTDEEIIKYLENSYLLSNDKANLTLEVAKKEREVLQKNYSEKDDGYHMYIGIPFCKSKCNYCSFTSFKIDKYVNSGQDEVYVNALIKEITETKHLFKYKKLKSIYIGGGTPSSITHNQIEKILQCVVSSFDLSHCVEFSFEAGRADTITIEKLEVLKKYNVNRIAINPQSMNDKTLNVINRTHTVLDFVNCYNMAKSLNFDNINIDLIFGLTSENYDDFLYSVKEVINLNPDSITIHTLAVKRGATIQQKMDNKEIFEEIDFKEVNGLPVDLLKNNDYIPYYMYRQKNMVGTSNFENLGFSKNGKECLYNIITMEEKEDIVAFGAGSTSRKILDGNVERTFNVTGVEEYILRIDEMINRKKDFYKGELYG